MPKTLLVFFRAPSVKGEKAMFGFLCLLLWGRNCHKRFDQIGKVRDDAKGVEAQLFELLLEDPLDGFLTEVGVGNQLQVIQLEVLLVGGKIDWKRSCGKYCDGKPA